MGKKIASNPELFTEREGVTYLFSSEQAKGMFDKDLANLIGVTRESVNLALPDFRDRGLVETEGRSLRVLQPENLRALT